LARKSTALRFSVPALLALLASPAAAFDANLVRSDGVLGSSVGFAMDGDPFEVYVLMPSFQGVSIPLASLGIADPRSVDVGLDLLGIWQVGGLDAGGLANVAFPLPADVALAGFPLYGQFLTVPGTTTLVDEISNRTGVTLGVAGSSVYALGTTPTPIDGHTLRGLDDGSAVMLGGTTPFGTTTVLTSTILRFDPQTQEFGAEPGALLTPRTAHTATKLQDGRILIAGGTDLVPNVLSSVEIYDPVTGISTAAASMSAARTQHTATLLNDGRVFVAGGTSSFDFSDPLGAIGSFHKSTEIFDPVLGTWSSGPNLPKPLALHTASLTGNGEVLIVGGVDVTTILFVTLPDVVNDCHRFNPAGSGSIVSTPSIAGDRALGAQLTLSNGDVLVAGGVDGDLILQTFTVLSSCSIYDASANTWNSAAALGGPRVYGQLFETGGTVSLLAGVSTFDIATTSGTPAQTIETAPLGVTSWTPTASMLRGRFLASSAVIEGGERILVTGSDGTGFDTSAETYIP
jgi:hypothetical protein